MHLSKSASKFNNHDLEILKIKYKKIDTFDTEGVFIPDYMLLNGYNRNEIINLNDKLDKVGGTMCDYIIDVLQNECSNEPADESNTGDFVQYLLRCMEFDERPFKIKHQQKYFFQRCPVEDEDNDKPPKIYARPDLSIIKGNKIMMIDEDKHTDSINTVTMGKPQIAAEMIAVGFKNIMSERKKKRKHILSSTVYAMRVIGVEFTFYKTDILDSYLNDILTGNIVNGLTIYEFTNTEYDTLDFCDPNERKIILGILYKLKSIFLED